MCTHHEVKELIEQKVWGYYSRAHSSWVGDKSSGKSLLAATGVVRICWVQTKSSKTRIGANPRKLWSSTGKTNPLLWRHQYPPPFLWDAHWGLMGQQKRGSSTLKRKWNNRTCRNCNFNNYNWFLIALYHKCGQRDNFCSMCMWVFCIDSVWFGGVLDPLSLQFFVPTLNN